MKKTVVMVLFLGFMAAYCSVLFAGGCPLTGGGGGYSSGGMGRPGCGGDSKASPTYILYKSVNVEGLSSYGVIESSAFNAKSLKFSEEASALRKALPAAQKKWKEQNPGVAFPLKKISVPSIEKMQTFSCSQKAEASLKEIMEQEEKKVSLQQKANSKRDAGLTEEQKKDAEKNAALCTMAYAMVKAEMSSVLNEEKAKASESSNKTGQYRENSFRKNG